MIMKMTRKQRKTVLAALREWAINNGVTDKSILRQRFDACAEEPDPIKAVEREKNAKFNRFVASIRNERGLRMAFPVKKMDGKVEIHIIPGSRDYNAVSAVEKRLTHNVTGNRHTRRPVAMWKAELAGQMKLDLTGDNFK